jgi:hypothetical protein
MRKLKDVLRLRFKLGLGQRQIARSCSVGLSTVHDDLQRAEAAVVKWPLPEGWDEQKVESSLFAASQATVPLTAKEEGGKALPDFAKMHEERAEASPSYVAVAVGGIQTSESGRTGL